jgi:hypothetical protein
MQAKRARRLPSAWIGRRDAHFTSSMTQPEDLPDPNDPIRPRMNARDWLKSLIVGMLAYEYLRSISRGSVIGRPGKDHP